MTTCRVNGCDKPVRAHGLCHGHLERTLRPRNRGRPGEAALARQWPKWTAEDDRKILDLPTGRNGHVVRGRADDLAAHLGRTRRAVHTRRNFLLRERRRRRGAP